jgi:UDP-GlcNAc:undecaprenyl-phosphate GlcNAc-1-phosphate transferase
LSQGAATAAVGLVVAGLATLLMTPVARRVALSRSFFDQPGAHKSHDTPVPYLGGLALALGVLLGAATVASIGFTQRPSMVTIVLAATTLAVLGGFDDKHALRADVRLVVQALAAAAVIASGTRLTVTGSVPLDSAITLVWILTITNALNFVDNMDGLAGGLGAAGGLSIAVVAGSANPSVTMMGGALCGGCLGFLFWNRPPARIYMGDTGSLFIGFLLATLSVNAAATLPLPQNTVVPMIILAVPLLDIATVTVGRIRRGIPITTGGRNHLSHRLVAQGWSRGRAVLLLVGLSGLLGLVAVGVTKGRLSTFTAVAATAIALAVLTAMTIRVEVFVHDGKPRLPRVLLLAIAPMVVIGAVLLPSMIAIMNTRHDVAAASNLVREAIAARERGDTALSEEKFTEAARRAARVRHDLSASFVSIGEYVPVVRDNLLSSREVADVVTDLSSAARASKLNSSDVMERSESRLSHSDNRILLRSVSNAAASLQTTVQQVSGATPAKPKGARTEDGPELLVAILAAGVLLIGSFALILRRPKVNDADDNAVDGASEVFLLSADASDVLVEAEAGQSTS